MFEHLDNPQPRVYSQADRAEVARRVSRHRRRRRHARLSVGTFGVIGVIVAAITFFGSGPPSRSEVRVGTPATTTTPAPSGTPPTTIPAAAVPLERPSGPLQFPEIAVAAGPSTIYLVGTSDRCDCLALDRSVNNADSFTRVTLPDDVADENDIGFETPTDGYAIAASGSTAVVWVTDNAARSWIPIKLGTDLEIVAAATTPTAVYLITAGCKPDGTCRCTHGCDLVRIPAGTATATTIPLPATASNKPGLTGISLAATGKTIWIFDTDTHRAITSTDAGRSFKNLTLALTTHGCHYSATSPTVLWSQCNHVEYRSDNRGRTFTPITSVPDTYTWDPINTSTVYVAAEAHPYTTVVLERSTNAGRTFTTALPPTPDQYCTFTFTTASTGIALCYAGPHAGAAVFATRHNGRTWTSAAVP